jgi:DNA-binding CsgD family transcriptional regulator
VSIDSPDASEKAGKIAVALAIDDAALRSRVLHALDCSDGRFVVAPGLESADILIADHLAESDVMEVGLPAIVVGDRSIIDDAVRRGYAGGVLASFSSPKLRAAIAAVAHGLICTDAHTEPMPIFDDEGDTEPSTADSLAALTIREAEVLRQLVTGASNKEIARRLDISTHTAKFHVASIVSKLGATGRTDAVARALRRARAMI